MRIKYGKIKKLRLLKVKKKKKSIALNIFMYFTSLTIYKFNGIYLNIMRVRVGELDRKRKCN